MERIAKNITLWTVLVALFTACSLETGDKPDGSVAHLQVTLGSFKGNTGTRTQETEYQTSFTGDEQIGVFALNTSNNTILDNNVPYKYNATTSSWNPVNTGSQALVYGSGVTYYAYYPYSSSMDDKKSIAEIAAAFTLPQDQSTYPKYTSADLMTATGALSNNTLNFAFVHALSLIEIEIDETTNTSAPYDPNPAFHGTIPYKMPDGVFRYLVPPAVATEIAFDYGPADNRYFFQKSLTADVVGAGSYVRVKAPFINNVVDLNIDTGNYAADLGTVSKVIINGNEYTTSPVSGSNSKYTVNWVRRFPDALTSLDIYITDNLAKADQKEQLLVSATVANVTVDTSTSMLTVSLSKGGMEGEGSSAFPYIVATPPQLRGVGQNTSAQYKQVEDINLSIYSNWESKNYSGVYDGNHKKISNLTCNGSGLFSTLSGQIRNAHIASGSVTKDGRAGGFCENVVSSGIIENCSNAATITGLVRGSGFFGGICGELHGKVLHCKNTGTILGKGEIFGGVVGWVNEGSLQYSYNAGEVKPDEPWHGSKPSGVGGVAGAIYYGSASLTYSYNIGIVKTYDSEVTSGGGSGAVYKGEIAGWTDSGRRINNNWYNAGTKPSGDMLVDTTNKKFDNVNNNWPVYDSSAGDGWTSTHWKPFVSGEYPKLLWED